jgi:tRNA threonylcarbamoyladenosine biosynthesis protein TsaB
MLVLAIDTTSEHGGVAVFRDAECLAEVPNAGSSGYSVTLFQAVDRVLNEAGAPVSGAPLKLRDIELFAAATGPGSFTRIRTGLAATQGWATALGRPTWGASILEAMAREGSPETEWTATLMDARRDEFYCGLFRRLASEVEGEDILEAEGTGQVLTPTVLRAVLEERLNLGAAVTCVVREHDEAAQSLGAKLPRALRWTAVKGNLLGSIAQIALGAYRRGKVRSPAELDACYIRRADAELNWRF